MHAMRSIRFALLVLIVALTYLPARAQDSGDAPKEARPLLEQVRALGLDSLQRGRTTVHFTPGHRDEAEQLGPRVDRALQMFSDSLGADLDEFHLIMPNESHWEQLAEWPYGVPIWGLGGWQDRNLGTRIPGRPPSTIVPVDAKGAVFEQLLTLEECLSPTHRDRLEQVGLSWEEAAQRYVEAITFHELGHGVTGAYEIGTPLWFNEFLTNHLGYAYLYYTEPKYATVWDVMTAVTLECQMPTPDRTLEASLRLGQGADDYHWYQSYLIQRANRVVETHGFDFLREAQKAFPPTSSAQSDPLREKEEALEEDWDRLSDEEALQRLEDINDEMLRRLEQIAPGFQAWAERFEREDGGED